MGSAILDLIKNIFDINNDSIDGAIGWWFLF